MHICVRYETVNFSRYPGYYNLFPMIELDYFFETPAGETLTYQLIQFSMNGPWSVLEGDEFLGSIEKRNGKWMAVLGEYLPCEMIQGAGSLIDQQYYQTLPSEVCTRWPKLIAEVITKSDHEYMVICKPLINFEAFERIFTKFVPGLLKDEWSVDFQVYNHDFSEDFVLEAINREEELSGESKRRWEL
jgi:hypothetical protein